MTSIASNIFFRGAVSIVLAWSSILCFGAQSVSDDFTDRRITAGTKIFRAFLAADSQLSAKQNGRGALRLCLVYRNNQRNAELSADILHSRSDMDIRGIEIDPEFVSYRELLSGGDKDCAGIFLTEQLSDEILAQVIAIAGEKQRVLFSPFEGDVERGVLGGIKVESRVLPYVNEKAIRKSNIALKSFFMKIAKKYEE